MISRPRLYSALSPLRARAREGQAVVCPLLPGSSPTRWVAPKQHWGLGRAFSPAFRAGGIPLGAGVPKNLARRSFGLLVSAARYCSTGSGRLGGAVAAGRRRCRLYSPLSPLRARAREGQAVVCPLLRGSSPTRWVAPKQHWGLGRAFSPAFRAGGIPLGAGVPKNLARRSFGLLVSAARYCSTGSGR